MRKTLLCGVSAFAITFSAGNVMAADPVFVSPPAAPATWSETWAGPYFGVHLGYGFADTDGVFKSSETTVNHTNSDGLIYGAHAGYNWQSDNMVYGIEADVSVADIDEQSAASTGEIVSDIETLASLRLRLGFAMDDDVLLYATGGVAYMDANFLVHDSDESGNFDLDGVGGVLGVGANWRVRENVSFGLEGLWYFFDENESDFNSPLPSSGSTADFVEVENIFVVRLRANYHF